MSENVITRRSVLRTGALAAIAAGLMGPICTPPVDAQPAPTIDRAEALIVELAGIFPRLSERDQSNIGHVLHELERVDGALPEGVADAIDSALAWIGPGNRVHDRIDRAEEVGRRAAITA